MKLSDILTNVSYLLGRDKIMSPIPQNEPERFLERVGFVMAGGPLLEKRKTKSSAYKQKIEREGKKLLEREKKVGAVKRFFKAYGSPFADPVSKSFILEAEKYPITKRYPYLMPAISVLESSAGKKMTYPNNPLNWGIKEPTFQPESVFETINKATSGIGQRFPQYQKFRETGDLSDLTSVYAPPSDNNSPTYHLKLADLLKRFKSYEY